MATHYSILAWRIPWSLAGYSPWGCKRDRHDLVKKTTATEEEYMFTRDMYKNIHSSRVHNSLKL